MTLFFQKEDQLTESFLQKFLKILVTITLVNKFARPTIPTPSPPYPR